MAIDDPGIDTTYAAVLLAEDGDQETVLYTKNADERLYPASLTKVMTVLLAVEDIESGKIALSDPVTAQPGFDFDMIVGGSSVYIMQQETMTLESLLYCAMVASANDACNVIAQYVSGSISDFVARMNARARREPLYDRLGLFSHRARGCQARAFYDDRQHHQLHRAGHERFLRARSGEHELARQPHEPSLSGRLGL